MQFSLPLSLSPPLSHHLTIHNADDFCCRDPAFWCRFTKSKASTGMGRINNAATAFVCELRDPTHTDFMHTISVFIITSIGNVAFSRTYHGIVRYARARCDRYMDLLLAITSAAQSWSVSRARLRNTLTHQRRRRRRRIVCNVSSAESTIQTPS